MNIHRAVFLIYHMHMGIILLFLALFAAVCVGLLLIAWLKIGVRRLRLTVAAQVARRASIGPDGRPYPPAKRGLCDGCGTLHDPVYHLPVGRRLCPGCYREYCISGAL